MVSASMRMDNQTTTLGNRKERGRGIMGAFDDNTSRLDLKCDFPARESFRKELLARLRTISPQGDSTEDPSEFHARELSDSDLEMLAAAQGQTHQPDNWPWT